MIKEDEQNKWDTGLYVLREEEREREREENKLLSSSVAPRSQHLLPAGPAVPHFCEAAL